MPADVSSLPNQDLGTDRPPQAQMPETGHRASGEGTALPGAIRTASCAALRGEGVVLRM